MKRRTSALILLSAGWAVWLWAAPGRASSRADGGFRPVGRLFSEVAGSAERTAAFHRKAPAGRAAAFPGGGSIPAGVALSNGGRGLEGASEAGQKATGKARDEGKAEAESSLASDKKTDAEEYYLGVEYRLAGKPSFYFVLDLGAKVLELRVRGMTLRKWPIGGIRFWGEPAFRGESGTLELERKSALKVPERNVIKPGQAETVTSKPGEFELKALELKDMPDNFDLYFKSGLHIRVKTAGKGGLPSAIGGVFKWYIALPLRNLFSSGKGKGPAELEISVPDRISAQSIYWIFFEKIEGYIR